MLDFTVHYKKMYTWLARKDEKTQHIQLNNNRSLTWKCAFLLFGCYWFTFWKHACRCLAALLFACEMQTHLETGTKVLEQVRLKQQNNLLFTPPDGHLLDGDTKAWFPIFFVAGGGYCVKSLHWMMLKRFSFSFKASKDQYYYWTHAIVFDFCINVDTFGDYV